MINKILPKWTGSSKSKRRQAAKERIQEAYTNPLGVEVIPSLREAQADEIKIQRVAAYCRVSTDEDTQASSYELQVQYYTDMIKSNPQWNFVGIYADEGISGTSVNKRKEFLRLIEDCKAGKIDLIITKSISRFARNTLDCIKYVRMLRWLPSPVGIFFENERLNTLDGRNEAFIAMLSSVAQGESESKSESIKWSIKRRFSKGIPLLPTWNLLGYDKDKFGKMVIIPDEAEVVKYIYDTFLDGYSVREIAEQLTSAQIPTVKGNSIWSSGSVRNILQNERYCGDVFMQKTVTPNCLTHKSVKNNRLETQYRLYDHHEAIVPRSSWLIVQEGLKERRYGKHHTSKSIIKRNIFVSYIKKKGFFKGYAIISPTWDKNDAAIILEKITKKYRK